HRWSDHILHRMVLYSSKAHKTGNKECDISKPCCSDVSAYSWGSRRRRIQARKYINENNHEHSRFCRRSSQSCIVAPLVQLFFLVSVRRDEDEILSGSSHR